MAWHITFLYVSVICLLHDRLSYATETLEHKEVAPLVATHHPSNWEILRPSQVEVILVGAPNAIEIGDKVTGTLKVRNTGLEDLTFALSIENNVINHPSTRLQFGQHKIHEKAPTGRERGDRGDDEFSRLPRRKRTEGAKDAHHISQEVVQQTIDALEETRKSQQVSAQSEAKKAPPLRLIVQADSPRLTDLLSLERVPPPGVKRPESGGMPKTDMPFIKLTSWPKNEGNHLHHHSTTPAVEPPAGEENLSAHTRRERMAHEVNIREPDRIKTKESATTATHLDDEKDLSGIVANVQVLEQVGTVVIEFDERASPDEIANLVVEVAKDAHVYNLEADKHVRINVDPIFTPNDSDFDRQWGLRRMHLPEAWLRVNGEAQPRSRRPVVCVTDTGIDYSHPELADNMWINTQEAYGVEGVDDDANGFVDDVYGINSKEGTGQPKDGHGHGSHCAGVVGAKGNNTRGIAGVNWAPLLMGCKFLDDEGSGSTTDAIKCLNYAVMMGADITSNSWGGPGASTSLVNAIDSARQIGQLFVAAAGNDGLNVDEVAVSPGSIVGPNVITVAAIGNKDEFATFSNYGKKNVEVGAPGVDIWSTGAGKNGPYFSSSGTSMAAPHVAGLAALVLSANPDQTFSDILDIFHASVEPVPSLADKTNWGGIIDANKAIRLAVESSPWLALSTQSVVVEAGKTKEVSFDINGRQMGEYSATIRASAPTSEGSVVVGSSEVGFKVAIPPLLNLAHFPTNHKPLEITYLDLSDSTPSEIVLENEGMGVVKVTIVGISDVLVVATRPVIGTVMVIERKTFLEVRCLDNTLSDDEQKATVTVLVVDSNGSNAWQLPVMCRRIPLAINPVGFDVNVPSHQAGEGLLLELALGTTLLSRTGVSATLSVEFETDNEGHEFIQYAAFYPPSFADVTLPPGGGDEAILWAELRGREGAFEMTELHDVDDAHAPVDLPFDPLFNGQSQGKKTKMWVSTNGFASLQPWDHKSDWRVRLGTTGTPNAIISPFWADLTLSKRYSTDSSVWAFVSSDRVIVQWNNMGAYQRDDVRLTFQMHLLKGGDVGFVYFDTDGPIPGRVGLEDASGQAVASFDTRPGVWPRRRDWVKYKSIRTGRNWVQTLDDFRVLNFPIFDVQQLLIPIHVTPLNYFSHRVPGLARVVLTVYVENVADEHGDFVVRTDVPISVTVGSPPTTTTTSTATPIPGCPVCADCPVVVNVWRTPSPKPQKGDHLLGGVDDIPPLPLIHDMVVASSFGGVAEINLECAPMVFKDFSRFEHKAFVDLGFSEYLVYPESIGLCECLTICRDSSPKEMGGSRPCKGVQYRYVDELCQLIFVNRFDVGSDKLLEFREKWVDYMELKALGRQPDLPRLQIT
eukprot:GHVN01069570.1.p1 GENE.GHVN01069570.1~~GHVN01069570.1.p1  ORF type:complete len:1366 (-),score=193.22 GHVN01069570.1:2565-6662(-)